MDYTFSQLVEIEEKLRERYQRFTTDKLDFVTLKPWSDGEKPIGFLVYRFYYTESGKRQITITDYTFKDLNGLLGISEET